MSDTWDGRPENPERDGWHWIMTTGGKTHACFWYANLWTTPVGDGALSPEDVSNWRYLGPVLTPAEIAAQVEAAERRGMERAAHIAQERESEGGEYGLAAKHIASAIRDEAAKMKETPQ